MASQKQVNVDVFAAVCTINPDKTQSPQGSRALSEQAGAQSTQRASEVMVLTVDLNQFLGFLKVIIYVSKLQTCMKQQ